jgi:DNA helicase-2/ATP-dependent DNA helicase PcrA
VKAPGDLLAALDPDQRSAVTHGEGPQLVLAGAGSGKTRVITYRIAFLVRECGVAPEAISAMTFTNKAAAEMRERVQGLLGWESLPTFVGTFHRFALRGLRRFGRRVGLAPDFAIFDTKDQLELVKRALELEGLAEASFPPRTVLSRISGCKNRLQDPEHFAREAAGFFEERIAPVYRRYQGLLHKASAVDFDDMLFLAVRLLREAPEVREWGWGGPEYLLVDEFQDTNTAQLELVRLLIGDSGNLTAVGDEDQGIYRWRGAELQNILEFEKSFPGATVRKLERNYRSTKTIVDAAGAVVANNRLRRGKTLWTDREAGARISVFHAADEGEEATWIGAGISRLLGEYRADQIAVLVRTHAQTRVLEEDLLRRGIPYQLLAGVRFYDRAEIKDLLAWLRVLRNPRDDWSLSRVINVPPRGIGAGTIELLTQRANELGGLRLWDVLAQRALHDFPSRGRRALEAFAELVESLQRGIDQHDLPGLLLDLLQRTRYRELYASATEEDEARLANIDELVSAAGELQESDPNLRGAEALTAFLDHVSLVADVDGAGAGGVLLMTFHTAKGLEFPAVFLAGLEDGLMPHFNSKDNLADLEEERRLLYVGMTRAQEQLRLSTCRRRRVSGTWMDREPSAFLTEVPGSLMDEERSSALWRPSREQSVYNFFQGGTRPGPPASAPRRAAPTAGPVGGSGFRPGTRVVHPTLGPGVILEVDTAGEERLTVFFERAGKRRLVAKYANLTRL